MPTFGDYETVGEPVATRDERGDVSTVWQARKSGSNGGRLYAIKCYAPHRREPKEGQPEDALDEERSRAFLEGIKQLKKAHSEGGRFLPPIHAFGLPTRVRGMPLIFTRATRSRPGLAGAAAWTALLRCGTSFTASLAGASH